MAGRAMKLALAGMVVITAPGLTWPMRSPNRRATGETLIGPDPIRRTCSAPGRLESQAGKTFPRTGSSVSGLPRRHQGASLSSRLGARAAALLGTPSTIRVRHIPGPHQPSHVGRCFRIGADNLIKSIPRDGVGEQPRGRGDCRRAWLAFHRALLADDLTGPDDAHRPAANRYRRLTLNDHKTVRRLSPLGADHLSLLEGDRVCRRRELSQLLRGARLEQRDASQQRRQPLHLDRVSWDLPAFKTQPECLSQRRVVDRRTIAGSPDGKTSGCARVDAGATGR